MNTDTKNPMAGNQPRPVRILKMRGSGRKPRMRTDVPRGKRYQNKAVRRVVRSHGIYTRRTHHTAFRQVLKSNFAAARKARKEAKQ